MVNVEEGRTDPGARVIGAGIHGLFDAPEIMKTWLDGIGLDQITVSDALGPVAKDREHDLLADYFERFVDMDAILKCLK